MVIGDVADVIDIDDDDDDGGGLAYACGQIRVFRDTATFVFQALSGPWLRELAHWPIGVGREGEEIHRDGALTV